MIQFEKSKGVKSERDLPGKSEWCKAEGATENEMVVVERCSSFVSDIKGFDEIQMINTFYNSQQKKQEYLKGDHWLSLALMVRCFSIVSDVPWGLPELSCARAVDRLECKVGEQRQWLFFVSIDSVWLPFMFRTIRVEEFAIRCPQESIVNHGQNPARHFFCGHFCVGSSHIRLVYCGIEVMAILQSEQEPIAYGSEWARLDCTHLDIGHH
jgi:hypothetical protein